MAAPAGSHGPPAARTGTTAVHDLRTLLREFREVGGQSCGSVVVVVLAATVVVVLIVVEELEVLVDAVVRSPAGKADYRWAKSVADPS